MLSTQRVGSSSGSPPTTPCWFCFLLPVSLTLLVQEVHIGINPPAVTPCAASLKHDLVQPSLPCSCQKVRSQVFLSFLKAFRCRSNAFNVTVHHINCNHQTTIRPFQLIRMSVLHTREATHLWGKTGRKKKTLLSKDLTS